MEIKILRDYYEGNDNDDDDKTEEPDVLSTVAIISSFSAIGVSAFTLFMLKKRLIP